MLGVDERAAHFWRCRLQWANPVEKEESDIKRLLERRRRLLEEAEYLVAEANAVATTLCSIGVSEWEVEIIAKCGYAPPTCAWPWTWTGSTWEYSSDCFQGRLGRVIQYYKAYPPNNAPGGAKRAWGQFTYALQAPPTIMTRHFGDGFWAIYEDIRGKDVDVSLGWIVAA